MKFLETFLFRAILLALILVFFQTIFSLKVNLLFTAILVFASLLGSYETLVLAAFGAVLSSAVLYHQDFPWFYIAVGLVASLINPKQIPDKFIVSILYVICFTALAEIFNPNSSSYFDRLIETIPITAVFAIPMHFIFLYLFHDVLPKRPNVIERRYLR